MFKTIKNNPIVTISTIIGFAVVVFAIFSIISLNSASAYTSGGGGTGCGSCGSDSSYSGAGEGGHDAPTITVTPYVAPTCTVSFGSATITEGSKTTVTLHWNRGSYTYRDVITLSYPNGTSWKSSNDAYKQSNVWELDARSAGLAAGTYTYKFNVKFNGGSYAAKTISCTGKLTVKAAPKVASCDAFVSTPADKVYHAGDKVTLQWNTTNATSVSINNSVGTVAADGSKSVIINKTTTYTLTAKGTGGNDTCTTKVVVTPKTVASCDAFTVSKNTVPYGGGNVTLNWSTTNASAVSISGIGNVAVDGSKSVFVSANTTYTLTAKGTDGNDTCVAKVTVVDEPETIVPKCDFLNVSDSSVEDGDEVTLSWGTTNADSVYINNGVGTVSADGSTKVEINDDITYTLTATKDGKTDTCKVSVNVEDESSDPTPRCELDISDSKVNSGDEVTLSWETKYADDIVIKDDNGDTIFDTDDYSSSKRKNYYDGEVDVKVSEDTKFTLTAKGDGGRKTCTVRVSVEDNDVIVYEKRDQPLVVSLEQVPYTGFEAGPALTFIFYGLLTLWAMFIAYILVIKKGTVLGFSLAGNAAATEVATADEIYKKKVDQLMEKYAGRAWK